VDVVLEWLEPNSAEEAEFEGFYEVASTARAVDLPDEEPMTYDEVANRLRNPFPGLGEVGTGWSGAGARSWRPRP
jgi:hypothetical protein